MIQLLDEMMQYFNNKFGFYGLMFFPAWIWISTTACPWYEACRASDAEFLYANCPTGAAGAASRWKTCRSCSYATNPAAAATDAAAGRLYCHHFISILVCAFRILLYLVIFVNDRCFQGAESCAILLDVAYLMFQCRVLLEAWFLFRMIWVASHCMTQQYLRQYQLGLWLLHLQMLLLLNNER